MKATSVLQSKKKWFEVSNLLPLFVVISLVGQVVQILLLLLLTVGISFMANKPPPSLVQLDGGRSITVEPVEDWQRTPDVIQTFVRDTLSLMFTWTPVVGEGGPGKGVAVGDSQVTVSSWEASFAFSEGFRGSFLEAVGSMTPRDVFQGNAQSVLSIESISEPQLIGEGVWEVDVVANLLIFDSSNPQGLPIPFNKTLVIGAVEPALDPLPEETSPIQKAVYAVRAAGLEISEMRDLRS